VGWVEIGRREVIKTHHIARKGGSVVDPVGMACEVVLGGSDELDGPESRRSAGVVVVQVAGPGLLASECVNSMPAVADREIKHQLLSSRIP